MADNDKVLIVGGGIGGLAAAIALRQVGKEPLVFEQAGELREIGAALTLWSNAVKVLRKLGVGDAVEGIATVVERYQARTWQGQVLCETSIGEFGRKFGAPSICVHRAELLKVLDDALGNEHVRLNARCVGFEQDGQGVTAGFADGRREKGAVLVGCDGIHSVVRAQLIGQAKPRYAGYTCWRGVARFQSQRLPPGLCTESFGRGQKLGMINLTRGRMFWYATKNAPEGGSDADVGRKREVLNLFRGWHEPIEALIEATDETGIFRNDICDREPISTWGTGRVTLLGDAAHPTTPNYGQGACQAIEDALVLARELAATADTGAALRGYEGKRLARANRITVESRRYGAISQWQNPLACWLRDLLIKTTYKASYPMLEDLLGYDA